MTLHLPVFRHKTLSEEGLHPIANPAELWVEQETGESGEAKPLKMKDRLLPFLHNIPAMVSPGEITTRNEASR